MGISTDIHHNHEIVRVQRNGNSTVRITVSDVRATEQPFALAVYSAGGLLQIPCNETCTDTEVALECDWPNGVGIHECSSEGEWDLTTCRPYACLDGYVFAGDGDSSCVAAADSSPTCVVPHGFGLNISSECKVNECEESYRFNGTGCTCYGAKSSGSGERLNCLASGVFASPTIVSSDAERLGASFLSLVVLFLTLK